MTEKSIEQFSIPGLQTTEFQSGKLMERRSFLWLSVAAATSLAFPKNSYAQQAFIESSITWDDFLKVCLPRSVELYKDKSARGQESYLFGIASLAAHLNYQTFPQAKKGKFANLEPAIEFGVAYRGVPFFVVEWKMFPNSVLPPHCHPNASVCTIGINGEARLRNFEALGGVPAFTSKEKFKVRETRNEIISAGRVNTLTSQRDNIHTFRAGKEGAYGIDISTYHGKDIGFSFLNIEKQALDDDQRVFGATWKKIEELSYEQTK